jgi:hypothetical protein
MDFRPVSRTETAHNVPFGGNGSHRPKCRAQALWAAGFRISLVKNRATGGADVSDTRVRSGRIAIFFLAGMVRFRGMSSRALRCWWPPRWITVQSLPRLNDALIRLLSLIGKGNFPRQAPSVRSLALRRRFGRATNPALEEGHSCNFRPSVAGTVIEFRAAFSRRFVG